MLFLFEHMIIKKWRAYFSNQSINFSKYEIVPLINIQKGEGFWGYSDRDVNLSIDNYNLSNNNISLKNGWQIISFSSAFEPKYINAKIIWDMMIIGVIILMNMILIYLK